MTIWPTDGEVREIMENMGAMLGDQGVHLTTPGYRALKAALKEALDGWAKDLRPISALEEDAASNAIHFRIAELRKLL